MRGESELLSVVGQIYEVAADPNRFAELSSLLAPCFGTRSAMVHTNVGRSLDLPRILSATNNFDAWAWSAYVSHYHDRNIWFQRGVKKGAGAVVFGEELISAAALQRTEWFDYCQKLDAFHLLGINVWIADGLIGGVGFQRSSRSEPFDEEDRNKANALLPHLERALQIHHRIAGLVRERDIAFDVVDGLALGVLLVASDGRLLFANRVAERVLQGGQGLSVSHGRLCAQDHRQQQNLERMIGEAAGTSAAQGLSAGGTLSLPRIDGEPLTLLVSPFRAEAAGFGPLLPAAVVIFADPDRPAAISEKALMSAYRLTRAQARLLAGLLKGRKLTEYAATAGLSINTAKTLMSQVFYKTGHNRHADLVRAIAGNPVFQLADRVR